MTITVINDTHGGVLRSAGTTVASAIALRDYNMESFGRLVKGIDTDLAINGDMFDGHQIPLTDAYFYLSTLMDWKRGTGKKLYLLPGNHDLSKDSSKLSTFQFVANILMSLEGVVYLEGGGWLDEEKGVYAISHVANQDLFDLELSRVPKCKYLLLHCNWNNGFAKELDHSLNLSAEAAEKLSVDYIVLGHEHGAGTHLGGKVVIPGNQFPSSIADCLGRNHKRYVKLSGEAPEYVKFWDNSEYVEFDWKHIDYSTTAKFVRVTGAAAPDESTAAIDAVAKLRRLSDAFVVGSAVKMLGTSEDVDVTEALASVEIVRKFDVDKALREILREDQIVVLENLK